MTPFPSLRWKLVGSYLLLVAAVLLAVVLLTRYSVRSIFITYQQNLLIRQGQGVARYLADDYTRSHDWSIVGQDFLNYTRIARSEIWVVDAQGAPVLVEPTEAPKVDRPTASALRPALHGDVTKGEGGSILGRSGPVWVAVPIRSTSGSIIGAVYLLAGPPLAPPPHFDGPAALFMQSTDDFIANVESRLALIGILVGLFAVLLGLLLARSITNPIQELRRTVGRIAAGDLTQRARVRTSDEVGALADDVNRMASRLEAHMAELQRQESLRRDLVANVSHDLATPLTGIQGFTEALLDRVVSDEDERMDLYGAIYREAQRLRRLVGDLQDLSTLENGMGHIAPQPLRLSELVDAALRVEASEAQERGVTLLEAAPEELPDVLADGDRIGQVLLNLIDNALRYTPAGGSVTVRAERRGAQVAVVVADTGAGIPESEIENIFERFYRVDRSRSRATGGGGLGLAIVKAIVTAHGGAVRATSELGKGTQMEFTLPVAPGATPAPRPRAASVAAG